MRKQRRNFRKQLNEQTRQVFETVGFTEYAKSHIQRFLRNDKIGPLIFNQKSIFPRKKAVQYLRRVDKRKPDHDDALHYQ